VYGLPAPPPYACPPPEGASPGGGGFLNIKSACISLPQAIYILNNVEMHSPKLDKEMK